MRVERLILGIGTIAALSLGTAAEAIDPLDAIGVCARISKKDSRLECYDQVARDAASGRLVSSAPSGQGWASPPVGGPSAPPQGWATPPVGGAPVPRAQAPSSSFGAQGMPREEVAQAGSDGPDSIRAEVASSSDNGLGQWRIRLADGAIWQMTEREANFRPPAPREVVTIKKAALGSFLMDVGQQGSVRVRRIR